MECFSKAEHEFLLDVGIDYVPLNDIVRSIIGMEKLRRPTEEEFVRALDFIAYLFEKYGEHLKCSTGAGAHPIDKAPKELIDWLKKQFDSGKYTEIHYGIWFSLDTEVIPPEYIPDEVY
jgi:hypothetical protein